MARPTKLNAKVQEKIAKALLERSSREGACGLAGVTYRTFLNWLERGEAGEEPFADFLHVVKTAEGAAEQQALTDLHTAETQWQRFAWWLERRFPDRWGRKDRLAVGGDPNAPPVKQIVTFEIVDTAPGEGDADDDGSGA